MIKANDVADYFLKLAAADEDSELISNLKLQKLVYYAQGFHLAMFGKPLFPEPILAWAHGPVVRTLYDRFKGCGAGAISAQKASNPKVFTERQRELLNDVYRVYGQYSAWRLREMTHQEPPWKNTAVNNEISHEEMKKYFKTQVIE